MFRFTFIVFWKLTLLEMQISQQTELNIRTTVFVVSD